MERFLWICFWGSIIALLFYAFRPRPKPPKPLTMEQEEELIKAKTLKKLWEKEIADEVEAEWEHKKEELERNENIKEKMDLEKRLKTGKITSDELLELMKKGKIKPQKPKEG